MNTQCKYCKKESFGRPFCVECGKKYFGFDEPLTIVSSKKHQSAKTKNKTIPKEKTIIKIINKETTKYIEKQNDSCFDNTKLKQYNLPTHNNKFFEAKYQESRIYKCKNGNMVRSKSERTISDFLTEHKIEHAYEKELKIDNLPWHNLHPDFYIPGIVTHTGRIVKNIYIEHFGGPNNNDPEEQKRYYESVNYKLHIYENLKLTVVCTTEEDMINPNESLKKKLLTIKEHQINY